MNREFSFGRSVINIDDITQRIELAPFFRNKRVNKDCSPVITWTSDKMFERVFLSRVSEHNGRFYFYSKSLTDEETYPLSVSSSYSLKQLVTYLQKFYKFAN